MTDKKKYQVFLSSTYTDLKEERSSVIQMLMETDFIPCGMELFPSADDDQWTLIKKVIDECDYYILILAGRYGSLGPENKSYTQLEYEYAISRNKPVITFMHESPDDLPKNKCETSKASQKKLQEFRNLCLKKMVKYWTSSESLAGVVHTSLSKLVIAKPAVGWIRANSIDTETKKTNNSASDFFYTLDEKMDSNFTNLVHEAKSVSVVARTGVNLLSQYERLFIETLKKGCEVKLLFINPQSDAPKFVYGTNPDVFAENVRLMNYHLSRLEKTNADLFTAKYIKYAPTISMILIEKENPDDSFIIVQLYFIHSRISRDRPLFKVLFHDKWYKVFNDEFQLLWNEGEPITF